MKKILIVGIIFLSIFEFSIGQDSEKVKWYTIEEAEELTKTEPRKLFIDVYTDWCGWCKKLDKETFTDPVIANILNTEFYAVKFDAESKEPIEFMGHTFINKGTGTRGTHQLAAALLQGKMSYPSAAYMNERLELLFAVPGYFSAKDIEPLLHFISSDSYQTTDFQKYKESFQGKVE